ncbi:MAG: ShlB/FhaC/HecB family hemolysin secretion/activation protein [Chlorobiaceae bacterium]
MAASLNTLLFILAFTASTTFAANMPDAGRLLNENATTPSSFPWQAPPEHQQQIGTGKQKLGSTRIKVSGFTFTGNTLFSDSELSDLMANYKGEKLTLAELDNAVLTITNAYRKKGYFLASAFLPPQTLTPGTPLIIEVIEGVLEKMRVETKPAITRTQKSLLEYYANQVPSDQPLENGTLTSMVMRTNELPNISSRILLEPGSRPGTTKATLEVIEGKPYGYSVNIDNYGNEATGANHISGCMELYSPLHLGDQLTLRMQTSTIGNLQNVQTGYTIPVTPYGTKFGFNYNYVNYQMGGIFQTLKAYGNAHNLIFSLTQPIIRNRNLILNATLAGEGKMLDDRIESVQSRNQRLSASCQTGLTGIQMDNMLGGGSTALSLGFVRGQLSLNDAETLSKDQTAQGLQSNGGYTKLNMSLARTQMISHGLTLYAGAYGQWSNKNLNSSEQLSLAGPSAVRAWQTSESYADKGVVATAELRYLFDSNGELPGKLELSAFVDHGYAALHITPLPDAGRNTSTLTGAGFGVKWFDAKNYSFQSTAAWKISGASSPTESPMVYAQATKSF